MEWGPAVYKLADCDAWIGWTPTQRAERLGLVAQNRCFLRLGASRCPNLASRALALAVEALPLRAPQLESLHEALRAVPDPRAPNRIFTCASLLTLVALGLLAGRKHLAEIQRFGQFLTQKQRARLGWPFKPGTRFRKAPSYSALYNLLRKLDPLALAAVLTPWLGQHRGTLPPALALDGKWVRDRVLRACRT